MLLVKKGGTKVEKDKVELNGGSKSNGGSSKMCC